MSDKVNDWRDQNDNLEFETKKIKFYPEDIEKMKHMSLKEEIEYMRKLKAEHNYTYEE